MTCFFVCLSFIIEKISLMKKVCLAVSAVMVFIACSPKVSSSSSSTSDKKKTDANALYNSEVKSIVEAKCTPCHFPDQGGNKAALNSFDAVSGHISEMIERVQKNPDERGFMPFKSKKPPLTAAEIASLKAFQSALGK